jgi:hypothetical protein
MHQVIQQINTSSMTRRGVSGIMKLYGIFLQAAMLLLSVGMMAQQNAANENTTDRREEQRLIFQTGAPWTPRTNLDADVAMVYGIGPKTASNLETWRQHRYNADVMTGVAWGDYQDYLNGQFDGLNHMDQAQMDALGNPIMHGGSKTIPYISPGDSYGRYLAQGVRRALDAGAQSIYLEEPEFWAASGWEENFKREWRSYYGEEWRAPNSSPDAQYRASKLKYFLYRRALGQVFGSAREYAKTTGRPIHSYVATHSLINYANWRIVSPESSLLAVGADGYIAQVWTGTARTPNYYDGVRKERTFETAFLEYGSMQNLARSSGRSIWFLNDPIEDDPNHDWNDYRANWESTLTASLLQPEVWRYEIMPWPERVFNSKHPVKEIQATRKTVRELEETPVGTALGGFGPAPTVEQVGIPKAYETELQSVINALGNMKQKNVSWEAAGTQNVGILVSDTMMFERADPFPSDPTLSSFYGLALPLLKHGVPVEPVQIESSSAAGFLNRYKMLLLTYEGQKPPAPEFHQVLSEWVREGGALVVVDGDDDPYNAVREWWNTAPNSYKTPREHLFECLGIPKDADGLFHVGRGVVVSKRISPAALAHSKVGGATVRGFARQAAAAANLTWKESNALVLRRGPYVVGAGLDDSISQAGVITLKGRYVNLFDANLAVLSQVNISSNARVLLIDLDKLEASNQPRVIAASCHVTNEAAESNRLTFDAEGIADTNAVVRIETARKPSQVLIGGVPLGANDFDTSLGTVLIHFPNVTSPVRIEVLFAP